MGRVVMWSIPLAVTVGAAIVFATCCIWLLIHDATTLRMHTAYLRAEEERQNDQSSEAHHA